MLFFRQSFEERKTQIILDCDGKQENDDEQDSESERHKLHFNSDYDILMQKIGKSSSFSSHKILLLSNQMMMVVTKISFL